MTEALQFLDSAPAWGTALKAAICERCNWRYLLPLAAEAEAKAPVCPHCHQAPLTVDDDQLGEMPHPYPPELVAPFSLSDSALEEAVTRFAKGIPYAPKDLNFVAMRARLTPIYLPIWLVDGGVQAEWQAEAGYNYEVVSHQEQYAEGGFRGEWQTREVREPRVRWEPRIGRLDRSCQNVLAPALEESRALQEQLGDFNLSKAQPYEPRFLEGAAVRLPDRTPQDAWSDAAAGFQNWAAGEVQKACAADHLRQFRWKASFDALHWTLLLLPAYTTFYLDDEGRPQSVLLHGQNGRSMGQRRASMNRARQASLVILIIGLALSLLGLIAGGLSVALPPVAPLAFIGLLLGIPTLLGALIPIGIAWDFNRKTQ